MEEIQANILNMREEEPISCTSLIMMTFSSAAQKVQTNECTNQCLMLTETEHKAKLNPGAHFFFQAVFPNSYFMKEMKFISAVNENRLELMSVSRLINSLPPKAEVRDHGSFMERKRNHQQSDNRVLLKQNTSISYCTRVSDTSRGQASDVYE